MPAARRPAARPPPRPIRRPPPPRSRSVSRSRSSQFDRPGQPVGVDVHQRDGPVARVGRCTLAITKVGDVTRAGHPHAGSDALGQGRLAGPQRAAEDHQVTGPQQLAERRARRSRCRSTVSSPDHERTRRPAAAPVRALRLGDPRVRRRLREHPAQGIVDQRRVPPSSPCARTPAAMTNSASGSASAIACDRSSGVIRSLSPQTTSRRDAGQRRQRRRLVVREQRRGELGDHLHRRVAESSRPGSRPARPARPCGRSRGPG